MRNCCLHHVMSNEHPRAFKIHNAPPLPSLLSNKKGKSAYILALASVESFLAIGASTIQRGVSFYVERPYADGSPHNETCGILGIRANMYHHLNNNQSAVFRNIKASSLLRNVEDVHNLSAKKLAVPFAKFDSFLRLQNRDTLLLLNVEPKGTGVFARIYPWPQITLPGGTMEDVDDESFENCAFREFKEETGLDIRRCCTIIHCESIQQLRHKYQAMNAHFTYNATFPDRMHTSMYFLCLTLCLPPPGLD